MVGVDDDTVVDVVEKFDGSVVVVIVAVVVFTVVVVDDGVGVVDVVVSVHGRQLSTSGLSSSPGPLTQH